MSAPKLGPSERDLAMAELGKLVEHLTARRTAGLKSAKTLAEQKAYREGLTVAIKAVASSQLLMSMLPDPSMLER
jgi:hypothetical protein